MSYRSIFRPGLFAGQTIVVTGGGSGIGRCTAHELKSLGARLALIGRTAEKLEHVKEELGDPDTFTFAADLRKEDQVKAAIDGVMAWSGRIDGLVNNAGGQFPAQLKDISLNGWNAVVANNLTATFLVSKEVYLRWMEKNGGAIVNVGADWDLGNPGMGHNGAARAGQVNFTFTASIEWAHSGVRVNSVIPGFIASSGLDRYPERAHEALRSVRSRIPLKRHGTESEIAGAIVYLLSDAAAYVTGATLRVDGGLHNNGKATFYEVPDHDRSKSFNGFPLYRAPDVLKR
ncbi:citronellol/citronellal dehydrogenase [Enhydrobacter aerosaccus]|uniref:Peroxisomal trans-2-enoyl-CoA reductase n=1 Tax=Enhydrobacter aerosaccus TaxID=225324 RepID=A0A1T4T1L2_9HYPH|nr:SDR family oxidoreductase [Enhydrobacter aerosaccus]SKA34277.1 citronellol/citronellal dehydrogenase [Enhydrobacter aerosaccus]